MHHMLYSVVFTFLLVVCIFYVHLITLKFVSKLVKSTKITAYNLILLIVVILFVLHLFEISIYALAYYLLIEALHAGQLHGQTVSNFMEYFYYSTVTYTSLGLGDIYPTGHIRFMSGIEALNGLLLISWSASFTFLVMKRLWPFGEQMQDG